MARLNDQRVGTELTLKLANVDSQAFGSDALVWRFHKEVAHPAALEDWSRLWRGGFG